MNKVKFNWDKLMNESTDDKIRSINNSVYTIMRELNCNRPEAIKKYLFGDFKCKDNKD